MLILCEDMFFFGGVRVPIYSLFVLCLGPNVAGSVCPSIHFSFCVLGPMLPGPCAHLFTFRSMSWAQCCRICVPIYSLFVLCLGPNVAGSVCPSIYFSFCVLGPMLPGPCAHLFTFRSVSWAQCCRVRVPIYSLFVLCLGPNVAGSVCPSIHFSFCVLGPMLPVSLHCPFLISPTFILWKTIIIVI